MHGGVISHIVDKIKNRKITYVLYGLFILSIISWPRLFSLLRSLQIPVHNLLRSYFEDPNKNIRMYRKKKDNSRMSRRFHTETYIMEHILDDLLSFLDKKESIKDFLVY
jgi:hypothetical protein